MTESDLKAIERTLYRNFSRSFCSDHAGESWFVETIESLIKEVRRQNQNARDALQILGRASQTTAGNDLVAEFLKSTILDRGEQ